MRIINRHFSNLLEGYERITEYHRLFDSLLERERARWRDLNEQNENAYRFQMLQHQQEIVQREALYQRAYEAWLKSEQPYL